MQPYQHQVVYSPGQMPMQSLDRHYYMKHEMGDEWQIIPKLMMCELVAVIKSVVVNYNVRFVLIMWSETMCNWT